MTREDESQLRANRDLFATELGDLPNFDRILVILDRFARILEPDDAEALVALIKIVAPDPEEDAEEDYGEDEDRDPDDDTDD